jgi:hypothetical protein
MVSPNCPSNVIPQSLSFFFVKVEIPDPASNINPLRKIESIQIPHPGEDVVFVFSVADVALARLELELMQIG